MEKIFRPDEHNKRVCSVIKEAIDTITADFEGDIVVDHPRGDWLSDVKDNPHLAKEFLQRLELASKWKEFYNVYGCKRD